MSGVRPPRVSVNLSSRPFFSGLLLDPGALAREIRYTVFSVAITVLAALAPAIFLLDSGLSLDALTRGFALLVLAVVAWGVLVHHVSRIGWLRRLEASRVADGPESTLTKTRSTLAILVPSYCEDARVVRRTLLSAALQEVADRRVVLLIDDPPQPRDAAGRLSLLASRRLPGEVTAALRGIGSRCVSSFEACGRRLETGPLEMDLERGNLAALHREVAAWFRDLASHLDRSDHEEVFFAEQVLEERARRMTAEAGRWEGLRGSPDDAADLAAGYRRLLELFDVEVVAFERKRYANLSHEPNKAMNLNSYLSLLGGRYREERQDAGFVLTKVDDGADADLVVPDADHVLMLDADTVLLPDYAARMVGILEAPGAASVAVAQTPYAAFPGARSALERIAGATTDVQFLLHQGMTRYGATFWVGANAVARVAALRELATTSMERGWPVVRFLHDRTVIEDTETSLELVRRGWSLVSHPEALAFSATPSDFGSLVVQRVRWANGGFLLLPALRRALGGRGPGEARRTLVEAAMRLHYLVSLGPMSLALLALPFLCFAEGPAALLLPLMTVGYFALYARDLVCAGYGAGDVVRVYALNLMLIPVNLAGLALSLRQAITGRKAKFVRTPKVEERTPVPGTLLVAEAAMLSFWMLFALHLAGQGLVLHAALVMAHVALLAWGMSSFVGWRAAATDFLTDVRGQAPPVEPLPLSAMQTVREP